MYLSFANERLTKGKADFFDLIKKVNLAIEENEKDSESSFSNERRQASVRENVGRGKK